MKYKTRGTYFVIVETINTEAIFSVGLYLKMRFCFLIIDAVFVSIWSECIYSPISMWHEPNRVWRHYGPIAKSTSFTWNLLQHRSPSFLHIALHHHINHWFIVLHYLWCHNHTG